MNPVKRSLHLLIEDAERLLQHVSAEAGEEVAVARKRLEHSIDAGKARLREVRGNAQGACRALDRHARHNPLSLAACCLTIGLLAGWILGARR